MEVVGTVINATVVAVIGLILAWLGKGGFEAQQRRIDRLEEQLEGRFDAVDRRLEAVDRRFEAVDRRFEAVDRQFGVVEHQFEGLRVSMDGIRSDLTQVALAVGVRRPRATQP